MVDLDQDHIGWKSWKLIARTIILPNPFALRSPKAIHLLPGKHGEIWGRVEVRWGKMAFWSTKAAISLKRVKINSYYGGGAIGTHLRSFERYRQRPPTASPWVCTPPKTPIAIISGTDKALRNVKSYSFQIWPVRSQGPSE